MPSLAVPERPPRTPGHPWVLRRDARKLAMVAAVSERVCCAAQWSGLPALGTAADASCDGGFGSGSRGDTSRARSSVVPILLTRVAAAGERGRPRGGTGAGEATLLSSRQATATCSPASSPVPPLVSAAPWKLTCAARE